MLTLGVYVCVWMEQRRIQDTLRDIRAFEPDVVLTIDSKGFSFRVLKALQADPNTRDSIKRMHYVAPSVWAYAHRQKRDFSELSRLLHRMFVILPFEHELFMGGGDATRSAQWCQFVGHPAVEDFLEFHAQFDAADTTTLNASDAASRHKTQDLKLRSTPDALLDFAKYDSEQLMQQTAVFKELMDKSSTATATRRREFGIPEDAFVICALVGR